MKAILFDFDGVIADTKQIILDFFPTVGIKVDEDFAQHYQHGYVNFLKHHGILDISEVEEKFKIYQHEQIDNIKIFPKLKETLEKLSKNYKLGIVTMNYESPVIKVLEKNGILHLFSAIIDQSYGHKPEPDQLFYCMDMLGVKPEETIYIGDEPVDIKAAKAANVKIIASLYGLHTKDILSGADDYIEKPEELLEKVGLD